MSLHPWPHLLPLLRDVFTPPPAEPIWVWAEKVLRLTPTQSFDYAGQFWSLDRVPHARVVFDFLADPYARELHIMKSSAAAFSTAILVGLCWELRHRPCRVLYVLNNVTEMRKVSKSILQPFLRQVFGEATIDSADQENLFIQLPNGSTIEMGSPTAGFFSNKQATRVVLDEFDLYPPQLEGGYDDPLGSARGRIKGSMNAKLFTLTAPQRAYDVARRDYMQPGTAQHRAYLSGDQREFRIACPKCAFAFAPRRGHLDYDHLRVEVAQLEMELDKGTGGQDGHTTTGAPYDIPRVRAEAAIRCPTCAHRIAEGYGPEDKAAVVRATGTWVPTVPQAEGRIWSAWYNDMCGIIGDTSLGVLAAELIAARAKTRFDVVQVLRARFAEPEADEEALDLSFDHVKRHCGVYDRGTCPVRPWFIALLVDCQKGPSDQQPLLFKWLRVAFEKNGTQRVIDYGQTASPAELRLMYEAPIPYSGPKAGEETSNLKPQTSNSAFYCSRAIIDSGYRAGRDLEKEESFEHHVYPLCVSWGWRKGGQWKVTPEGQKVYSGTWQLVPFKGRSREQMQHGEPVRKTRTTATHPVHGQVEIPLYLFNDYWFKDELYNRILAADPTPRMDGGEAGDPRLKLYPRVYLPRNEDELDDAFLAEITSERLVEKTVKIRGQWRMIRDWGKSSKQKNDWGDCLKMARVLWAVVSRPEGK